MRLGSMIGYSQAYFLSCDQSPSLLGSNRTISAFLSNPPRISNSQLVRASITYQDFCKDYKIKLLFSALQFHYKSQIKQLAMAFLNLLLSTLTFIALLINPTINQLSVLVTPADRNINAITTYQWAISNLMANVQNITLQIPSRASFNASGPTSILTSSNTIYNSTYVFSGNNVTIILLAADIGKSITLKTTNIKNGFNANTEGAYVFQITSPTSGYSPMVLTKGNITSCILGFSGVTDQQVSEALLTFKNTNPISLSRVIFRVSFGTTVGLYSSSSNKITENNNITCSVSINGATYSSAVPARIFSGSPVFDCQITSLNLSSNSNISLKLSNVRNPPYKSSYFSQIFSIQTLDNNLHPYDTSSSCSFTDVQVDSYSAQFSIAKIVNSYYTSPIAETTLTLNKNLRRGDYINVEQNGINRIGSNGFIELVRPNSVQNIQPINYLYVNHTGNTTITCVNLNDLPYQQNNKIRLTFTGFTFIVPPSASPKNMTIKFYRFDTLNLSVVYEYLNIFVTIRPLPQNFQFGDMVTIPAISSIGSLSSYQLRLNITQPLGDTSFILITLPLDTNLNQFVNQSACPIQSINSIQNSQGVCSIYHLNNRIIQVNINSTNGISAPQILNITVNNIVNPENPEVSYLFGAQTYYNQSDSLSRVEVGTGICRFTYTFRGINVTTGGDKYTVNQFPSVLAINHFPGVRLPSNLVFMFKFISPLSSVKYRSVTVGSQVLTFPKSQINLNINVTNNVQILAGTNVTFLFQFRAPSNVSVFPAVEIQVKSLTNVTYQKTLVNLTIDVAFPATEIFTLTPLNPTTGVVTTYTLSFFTNVQHPSPFFLLVTFPSDVTLKPNTALGCSLPCLSISNTTNSSHTRVLLKINSATLNTYLINVTNVNNSRKVGSTGNFTFQTFTSQSNGRLIINGFATVTIIYPNLMTVNFDKVTKQYYKMNIQPVTIIVTSLTNTLNVGDFFRVRFDYRTYSPATNRPILCTNGFNCSYQSTSTNFTTIIKVIPSNFIFPITFSIQGLNSSETTFPSQTFQVLVRSFSSDDRLMDQNKIFYNLTCRSTDITKICRTCDQALNICYSCYTGYYQYLGKCVTDCTVASTYRSFANTTQCVSCINNCQTCISATQCITCRIDQDFYLYENSSCILGCDLKKGYYNASSTTLKMCFRCWSSQCLSCLNGNSTSCTDCGSGFLVVEPGRTSGKCVGTCDLSSNYVNTLTKECLPCDQSCNGCQGGLNTQCNFCRPGYFNVSGQCINPCPINTVGLLNGTCGCQGLCQKCVQISTRCLSCNDPNAFLYNFQCMGSCPSSTYNNSKICVDCNQGCLSCTQTTCFECLQGYNVYENKCFTQCNNVGERFSAVNGTCIQCPVGCDLCDSQLKCSICLANYTLVNQSSCQRTCQLLKNCEKVNPVPDKIIPIPGFISACIWLIVIIVIKIFFVNKIYLPYSYIFVGCVVELVLTIVIIGKMSEKIAYLITVMQSSKRLMQTIAADEEGPQKYQYSVVGLVIAILVINYIANIIYVVLFCKYLKKYIPDRQIDKISNYLVIIIGVISNFRFSLVAYSKLFPKPNIYVENQSKLTPIHYLCIASLFLTVLPLAVSSILIYNEYPLTDLFMLGVDLLIISIISAVFTIWMVSVEKPSDYFESTKKYSKQQINNTVEALNQKEQPNESKHKLSVNHNHIENSFIQVEDVNDEVEKKYMIENESALKNPKSDNQNDPLPKIPIKTSQINISASGIKDYQKNKNGRYDDDIFSEEEPKQNSSIVKDLDYSLSDKKTKRNAHNKSDLQKHKIGIANNKVNNPHSGREHDLEGGIKVRTKEETKNFTKQKKSKDKSKNTSNPNLDLKINQISSKPYANNDSQYIDDSIDSKPLSLFKAQSESPQKQRMPIKSHTQRSSMVLPITMKKKESIGMFDSEKGGSQIDEIDFENLIQTKMVDKTKNKGKQSNLKVQEAYPEQISPSWFNEQNQRFDFESNSDV